MQAMSLEVVGFDIKLAIILKKKNSNKNKQTNKKLLNNIGQ